MTIETTKAISSYSNRYGDKLIEIMDSCNVSNLRDVPEKKALDFLKILEEDHHDRADN